jgi:glycogen synthase
MKICFVSREFIGANRAGGIATYVYLTSKLLISEGHEVFVITASDSNSKLNTEVIDGINVIRLKGVDYYWNGNKFLKYTLTKLREIFFFNSYRRKIANKILDLHNTYNIDLVEFAEYGNEGKFFFKKKDIIQIPSVVRFHGPSFHNRTLNELDLTKQKLISEIENSFQFDGISYCSASIKELLLKTKRFKNLISNFNGNQSIIFNSVNTDDFNVVDLDDEFIFFAGTLAKDKGFKELIEAVKRINIDGRKIKLILAGKVNSYSEKYVTKAKFDKNYKDWLHILGPIPRNELFSYYKSAKLNVFPSHWDNLPLTCIEAMSLGGLVLGSSSGGMKEIIEDQIDGYLVEPKNTTHLKEKITNILSVDSKITNKVRLMAIQKINNKFSNKIIYEEIFNFYDSVINDYARKQNKT